MTSLVEEIRAASIDGRLPCRRAFALAKAFGVEPLVVGREATAIGVKISECELGLFGHAPTGKGRLVRPDPDASPTLREAIACALCEGKLPCRSAWEIASAQGISRLSVSNAAEALRVRVASCQLGCFD